MMLKFSININQKNILWLHNKLQLEKAQKEQLFSILKNKITAVFVSKYLNDITSKLYNFEKRIVIPNFRQNFENLKINSNRKPLIIWSVRREKGLKTLLIRSNIFTNIIQEQNFIYLVSKEKI